MNATTATTLTICGVGISFDRQNADPSAANRIHTQATLLSNYWNNRFPDKADFAKRVLSASEDIQEILRAITPPNQAKDPNGVILSSEKVSQELGILAGDLEKIATATTAAIAAGKVGAQETVHDTLIVLSSCAAHLAEHATSLRALAGTFFRA